MRKPTTPPVRKAICIAFSRPPLAGASRAAAATRRFARVARAMPAPPMKALNTAPTMKKSDRPILTLVTLPPLVDRQQEEQHDRDDDEDAERLELAEQVGLSALLDRAGDLLHFLGALTGRQNRPDQGGREAQRDQRDDRGDDHVGQVADRKGTARRQRRGKSRTFVVLLYTVMWARRPGEPGPICDRATLIARPVSSYYPAVVCLSVRRARFRTCPAMRATERPITETAGESTQGASRAGGSHVAPTASKHDGRTLAAGVSAVTSAGPDFAE